MGCYDGGTMLKRLQLVGFKSFADRVDFDFPAGLTAIVGPNGSGKSNIVDAVRWVLGEQSAKSLRGGEMSDVIFNGSASRRSLGMAEVTLTFDNAHRGLSSDAEEIQVTRRVYRSGEGEYLINQQPCRLKDIKDLFLGSVAGTDAYSIIEQGRVDVLLQASTKERRIIFEEAAGISRFKAKKTETLRKLERVDQNLQRLKDILDEVEKQLRSVRLQAAKAQRYQEHSSRLKELRVGLGLQDYHGLARRLRDDTARLDELRSDLQQEMAEAEGWKRELDRLLQELAGLDGAVHEQESLLAGARQRIATDTATLGHETEQSAKDEADLASARDQLAGLVARVGALAAEAAEAGRAAREAEDRAAEGAAGVAALKDALATTSARLAELHRRLKEDQDGQFDLMRQASHFENEVTTCKAQLENYRHQRERFREKSDAAAGTLTSVDRVLEELSEAEAALQERLNLARQALTHKRQEREHVQRLHNETTRLAIELREQRSGLVSRVEVLERLERSHEGLDTGVGGVSLLWNHPTLAPCPKAPATAAASLPVPGSNARLSALPLGCGRRTSLCATRSCSAPRWSSAANPSPAASA